MICVYGYILCLRLCCSGGISCFIFLIKDKIIKLVSMLLVFACFSLIKATLRGCFYWFFFSLTGLFSMLLEFSLLFHNPTGAALYPRLKWWYYGTAHVLSCCCQPYGAGLFNACQPYGIGLLFACFTEQVLVSFFAGLTGLVFLCLPALRSRSWFLFCQPYGVGLFMFACFTERVFCFRFECGL